jgi:hypothetical protein
MQAIVKKMHGLGLAVPKCIKGSVYYALRQLRRTMRKAL